MSAKPKILTEAEARDLLEEGGHVEWIGDDPYERDSIFFCAGCEGAFLDDAYFDERDYCPDCAREAREEERGHADLVRETRRSQL